MARVGRESKESALRVVIHNAADDAKTHEDERYRERRGTSKSGEPYAPRRSMWLESKKMSVSIIGRAKKGSEKILREDFESPFRGNHMEGVLQRLHDGALNPEDIASPSEVAIRHIEQLGPIARIIFEGVPFINDIIDITLFGAKLLSADSPRSKVSAGADFLFDEIPGYGIVFPEGYNEAARDRIDEQVDMGHITALRHLFTKPDEHPSLKPMLQDYSSEFIRAMDHAHPYHASLHALLTSSQEMIKPFTGALQQAKVTGNAIGLDINELAASVLQRVGANASEKNIQALIEAGDKLHNFASEEIHAPIPMRDYVQYIINTAKTSAEERLTQAKETKGLGKDKRNQRRQLRYEAVRWQQAGEIAKEILETYEAAKAIQAPNSKHP